MANGFTNVDVWLSLPSVAHELAIVPDASSSDTTWHVRSCSESPHGAVVLEPDPGRFWRELLLVVIVAAANVALFVIGSRGLSVPRKMTIGLWAAAVAASIVVIASAGATAGDNMEVAGRMSHGVSLMYFGASLVIVLLGPIAAVAQPFYWRLPREARPRLRRRASSSEAGPGDGVR
jgi:hypothetical protein